MSLPLAVRSTPAASWLRRSSWIVGVGAVVLPVAWLYTLSGPSGPTPVGELPRNDCGLGVFVTFGIALLAAAALSLVAAVLAVVATRRQAGSWTMRRAMEIGALAAPLILLAVIVAVSLLETRWR